MNTLNHSNRDHALLSASGAHRWINCTPSARLEEEYGKNSSSNYAAEGTLAHELAELYLRLDVLHNITDKEFNLQYDKIINDELFNEEMLEMVPIYTDYCAEQYQQALTDSGSARLIAEQKLDLTRYVPESFGTADCVIVQDDCIEIIDLKYGKGVKVDAEWNKQLMLYALGALVEYEMDYDFSQVRMTIVQPRMNSISTFQLPLKELYAWADNDLVPAAKKAYKGEGDLAAGEWCRFCGVKNRCRKLYEQQMEIAKYEFAAPTLLTDEEIADILKRASAFTSWLKDIQSYALAQAVNRGVKWPNLKLVAGRSLRKWEDQEVAFNTILARFPEIAEEDLYELKPKTLTEVETLIGKKRFAENCSDLVIKPEGNPTLVDESDKRPEYGLSQAQKDFA